MNKEEITLPKLTNEEMNERIEHMNKMDKSKRNIELAFLISRIFVLGVGGVYWAFCFRIMLWVLGAYN